jgi:beta-lactam-binding protein with PASTA domain
VLCIRDRPVGRPPEPPASAGDAQAVMPRLAGLSLRQAMEALAPFGVRLEITGRGVVTGQTPPPGAPLAAGAVCRLQLASPAGRAQAAMAASLLP